MIDCGLLRVAPDGGSIKGKNRKMYMYIDAAVCLRGSGSAAAMALRATCSGIKIQDYTHLFCLSRPTS